VSGLGFILRRVKAPQYIRFLDQDMYFHPGAASSYGLHIVGALQEPETHKFLNQAFDAIAGRSAYFIEVGANVGAFMLDIVRRPGVQVIGFEPSKFCVEAVKRTMARNGHHNLQIFPQLVGDATKLVPFDIGRHDGAASVLTSTWTNSLVEQIRLDDAPALSQIPSEAPVVLMIDVEGYEPKVIARALAFIRRMRPLIVFEYNFVSKRAFQLSDIQQLLSADYEIFRLRKDGYLDECVDSAWNCVAVPRATDFESMARKLTHRCAD
jgi:FkbM family methyltransferase